MNRYQYTILIKRKVKIQRKCYLLNLIVILGMLEDCRYYLNVTDFY